MWEAAAICRGRGVRSLGVLVPWEGGVWQILLLLSFQIAGRTMRQLLWAHLAAVEEITLDEGFFSMPVCVSCIRLLLSRKGLYSARLRQQKQKNNYWKPHPLITLHHSKLPSIDGPAPQLTTQHCLLHPSLTLYFNSTDTAHCNCFLLEEKLYLSLKSVMGKHGNNCSIPCFPPNLFTLRDLYPNGVRFLFFYFCFIIYFNF